jgi:hypothetical protein
MRKILLLAAFLVPIACALQIELSVNDVLSVQTLYFSYNRSTGAFTTEFFNNGSESYFLQARIEVYNNETHFTAWSDRRKIMPGGNEFIRLFWVPRSGTYTAKMRIYYGNDFRDEYINITADAKEKRPLGISIDRVTGNYIFVSVNETGVQIVPDRFPKGWVVTQSAGSKNGRFIVAYSAPENAEREIEISAVSDSSYSSRTIAVKRDTGLARLIEEILGI